MNDTIIDILDSSSIVSTEQARNEVKELAKLQNELLTLTADFEDFVHLPLKFQFRRNKNLTTFFSNTGVLSDKNITVMLSHNNKNKPIDDDIPVKEGWSLSMDLFSDEELRNEFIAFRKKNPQKAMYVETGYYLDTEGNHAKTIMIHKDVKVEREQFQEGSSSLVNYYLSEMTLLDFEIIKNVLLMFKIHINTYRNITPLL